MTFWHNPREHCRCRQCNAERVKAEISKVHEEHKEAKDEGK